MNNEKRKENGTLPTEEIHTPSSERFLSQVKEALENPEEFWNDAAQIITWYKKWDKVLDESNPPFYKWFTGGKLNISYNAIDRHLIGGKRNNAAYIWIAEDGTEQILTYEGLYQRVNSFAKALLDLGLKKGDVVLIYLPMILELPVAMLAAARIGVTFSVVFSGFGAQAIADRINDSDAKVVITADGGYRKGKVVELKKVIDDALNYTKTVQYVVVAKRTGLNVNMVEGRDYWWDAVSSDVNAKIKPEEMDSNDPLYILYTSGTTGKPKGVVHGTGGYSVWIANTLKWAFAPKPDDRWWCAADIGWVTGHSYIVFAPLILGLTSILYEGALDYPSPDRMWAIIEKYRVNILYTSPTAIRMLMKYGDTYPLRHNLDSLHVLGTVGEPINPAAWNWYYKIIGKEKCPIIDTYWQTETGGFVISPAYFFSFDKLKPGSATYPMPGIDPEILDDDGKVVEPGNKGFLVFKRPWPGLMLTLNKDPERYKKVYFSKYPGKYLTGDYAVKDSDGYYWLLGRADEVLKVAGHRIGTIEIEDSLVGIGNIAEAAVFGKPDPIKGDAIIAFVTAKSGVEFTPSLINEIKLNIREKLGPIMVPEEIHAVKLLPKTRSGKIMRRVVKAVYLNQIPGDITTLEDGASLDEIKSAIESFKKEVT
ncbi:MAG: acetate--CoA ligase [Thermoplasmata archaeon]